MSLRPYPCVLWYLLAAGIAAAQTVEIDRQPITVTTSTETNVRWKVVREAGVVLQVVDASGRARRTIEAGRLAPGEYHARVDGQGLAAGQYRLRVGVNPRAEADLSFGVNGMLGVLSKKVMFRGERKIDLGATGADPQQVTVKVDGEDWARVDSLTVAGSNFVFSSTTGAIELNPAVPLAEGAEIAATYPAGLLLENPWEVQTAPDGSVCIGDALGPVDSFYKRAKLRTDRIYKVDAAGKPVTSFGANGVLETRMSDLAVGRDGNVYVSRDHHVVVFGPRGDPKYIVAGYIDPYRPGAHAYEGGYWIRSIALDDAGTMLIVNGNGSNLIYDPSKTNFDGFVAMQTSREGAMWPPIYGMNWGPCAAIQGSCFYTTTQWSSLVKYRFDREKKQFATVWATPVYEPGYEAHPSVPGSLRHAMGIVLDGSGLIYVADHTNHRVQVFFDAGETYKFVASLGAVNQMQAPHAVALAPDGQSLYVADDGAFYPLTENLFVKGLSRVTKLKLGFQETIEVPMEVK